MRGLRPQIEKGELFAVALAMLGGSRIDVYCEDGKRRMARIPGRMKRRIWIKEGDYLVVVPWEVQSDAKCDVKFRYTKTQAKKVGVARVLDTR